MAQNQKPPKTEVHSWINRFIRWLRSILGHRQLHPVTIKSRRYSSDRTSALFTLVRDTPGAVQTWRIVPSQATGAILITLDNLPDSRSYYKKQRREARKSGEQYRPSADERGLYLAGGEIHTHRFAISWIEFAGQKQKVSLLGVFDGDFAGFSKAYAMGLKTRAISITDENLKRQMGNRVAVKIGEAVALELLELKPLSRFTLNERLVRYDWGDVLLGYTRQIHGGGFDPKIICRSR